MFILKISKGQDLRRIAFDSLPTFDVLQNLTQTLFPSAENLTLKYEDDEGDVISIRSDMELQEAFRIALKPELEPPVLRLFVGSVEIVQEELEQSEEREEAEIATAPSGSSFFTTPEEDIFFPPEDEAEINILYRVEDKLVQITNKFSSILNEAEIPDHIHFVKKICNNQISNTWSTLKDKLTSFKFLVKGNTPSLEEEISELQEEIDRVASGIEKQTKQESSLDSSVSPNTIESVQNHPVEENPDEQIAEPHPYQSLPFEADIQMAEIVLPSNAALKDLQQLEGMGFLDRSKNLLLLTEHKGDIVAVVEALLSDE